MLWGANEEQEKQSQTTATTIYWKTNSSGAMLPNNHSLLADVGSYINVIGRHTLNKLKETAEEHGQEVKFIPRTSRTKVNGVGYDPFRLDG